jgi:hypothetical protein
VFVTVLLSERIYEMTDEIKGLRKVDDYVDSLNYSHLVSENTEEMTSCGLEADSRLDIRQSRDGITCPDCLAEPWN